MNGTSADVEAGKQTPDDVPAETKHTSAFKQLGLLDRLLAVWIFLAMAVGIILGNFVPSTGPALQKGKFVGVSVPIGMYCFFFEGFLRMRRIAWSNCVSGSCWLVGYDVPDLV